MLPPEFRQNIFTFPQPPGSIRGDEAFLDKAMTLFQLSSLHSVKENGKTGVNG
jgi:hypothetical protein